MGRLKNGMIGLLAILITAMILLLPDLTASCRNEKVQGKNHQFTLSKLSTESSAEEMIAVYQEQNLKNTYPDYAQKTILSGTKQEWLQWELKCTEKISSGSETYEKFMTKFRSEMERGNEFTATRYVFTALSGETTLLYQLLAVESEQLKIVYEETSNMIYEYEIKFLSEKEKKMQKIFYSMMSDYYGAYGFVIDERKIEQAQTFSVDVSMLKRREGYEAEISYE